MFCFFIFQPLSQAALIDYHTCQFLSSTFFYFLISFFQEILCAAISRRQLWYNIMFFRKCQLFFLIFLTFCFVWTFQFSKSHLHVLFTGVATHSTGAKHALHQSGRIKLLQRQKSNPSWLMRTVMCPVQNLNIY